ncbi:MAG: ABC transporter permease [Pseudomonadota bacterium]
MKPRPDRTSDSKPVLPRREIFGRWLREALDSDLAYSFRRSPVAIVAAVTVAVIVISAVLAPWVAPHEPFNPATLNLMDGFSKPMTPNEFTGNVYWLGTDDQGRDIFSAILYGSRISLFVGFAAVAFSLILGVGLGLLSGYRGGWIDAMVMRVADVQLSFPSILIALLIYGVARGFIPPTEREAAAMWVLILAIGLSEWVQYARAVRGIVLVEKEKEYVQAARLIGVSPLRITATHILPNAVGPILVIATIGLALAIIAEATLSFLGVGVPPTQPSLGTLIRIGQGFLFSGEWWILLFPALTLLALALSVNLLGDWLRDALNPRLR